MATIRVGAQLDTDTNKDLCRWAEDESRSKRRQAAVLLRKLTELRRTQPTELERLNLIERRARP